MPLVIESKKKKPPPDGSGHAPETPSSPPRALAKIDEAPEGTFPAGVMAGDAEPESTGAWPGTVVLSNDQSRAVLWTKYAGKKTQLSVRLHRTDTTPRSRVYPTDPTVKVKQGFAHFDAHGLAPGALYEYVFLEKTKGVSAVRSPVGRFRTPIAPDALEKVTFGGTSCTFQVGARLHKTNRTLKHAAKKRGLDFFLHAGDQVYCDAPKEKPAATIKGFRAKYQQAFSRKGLNALHETFGMYTTWDDHELFNGWQGDLDTAGKHKVNKVIAGKKNIGQIMRWGEQAFYDHQPIRRENRTAPANERKLWRSFRWGKTLELFILDCRSERNIAANEYISPEQEAWLIDGIRSSEATFKFILNSRPIGYFLQKRRPKPPKDPKKAKKPKEDYRWTKPWVAGQRERILKEARKTQGVWWLSGDVHFGSVGRVDPGKLKKGEKRVGEVLMGPGGQWAAKPKTPKVAQKKAFIKKLRARKHISFGTLLTNYVVIEVNPQKKREDSTLDIYFYHVAKSKSRQIHHERRSYAGKKLGAKAP